jgi:hypothetical protein
MVDALRSESRGSRDSGLEIAPVAGHLLIGAGRTVPVVDVLAE